MNGGLSVWRRRLLPDPILGGLGLVVLLVTLTVYLRTVAPTVSFWDCGEFVSCSHILGVPHPPGSPLYVLFGRIFSVLPTVSDIAHRINLLSVVSSAGAATIAFFILARLITWWYSDRYPDPQQGVAQRLSIYAGSFSGALMFAFSTTNWSNSVEAEVYGLSMLLMMFLLWLTLVWAARRDEPGSDRYLFAIAFIAFLSIGVHMTVFLVMPVILLAVILLSPRLRRDWRFWVAGAVMMLVTSGVSAFFWASAVGLVLCGVLAAYRHWGLVGILWSAIALGGGLVWAVSRGEPWPVFLAALVWGLGVAPWAIRGSAWQFPFAILLAAMLGFSVHLYIPIRAQLNPSINENDPKTWDAFQGFLERKQYGQQSMLARALTRRGQWSNQLGQHERMGFWGFFDRQYGFNDKAFFPILGLGLIGLWQLIRSRRALGFAFLVLLILNSVGLVFYMNFADGTRYDPVTQDAYLEVRDRDYFFTPAFILFGMAIGLGGAALIRWLSGGRLLWPLVGAVIVAALPIRALRANYFVNDRSNNYIAYDYAYNILMSADSSAVLFTNGDNDTFPVWCLQEVYGVRRDVRIANLSLLNTHWYIKQLKNQHDVPIAMSNDQIDGLVHYRSSDGKLHRLQDQMIDEILTTNKGKQPMNFAVTVGGSGRRYKDQPLDPHLKMVGLAYRLVPEEGTEMVDRDLLEHRMWNVFQFRGIDDPTVYKDANAYRMISNYSSGFFFLAEAKRQAGDYEGASRQIRRAMDLLPAQWEPYVYLAQLYADLKQPDSLESLLRFSSERVADRERVEANVAHSYRRLGNTPRAEALLKEMLARRPGYEPAFKELVQIYSEDGRYDTVLVMMEDWLKNHPGDDKVRDLLRNIRAANAASNTSSVPGDTSPATRP